MVLQGLRLINIYWKKKESNVTFHNLRKCMCLFGTKHVKIMKQETEKFTLNVIHEISNNRFNMISLKYGYCLLIWNVNITCS